MQAFMKSKDFAQVEKNFLTNNKQQLTKGKKTK